MVIPLHETTLRMSGLLQYPSALTTQYYTQKIIKEKKSLKGRDGKLFAFQ